MATPKRGAAPLAGKFRARRFPRSSLFAITVLTCGGEANRPCCLSGGNRVLTTGPLYPGAITVRSKTTFVSFPTYAILTGMNRIFSSIFTGAVFFLFSLSGCSKSTPVALESQPIENSQVPADRCGATTATLLIQSLDTRNSLKGKLEAEAKASPAKENFRKLFDSEVEFLKEAQRTLDILLHCEDPVAESVLEMVRKKVTLSRANVSYLAESFPDFK